MTSGNSVVVIPAARVLDVAAVEVPDNHQIARVEVIFSGRIEPETFVSSFALLRALFRPPVRRVLALADGGRVLDADGLAALNAFLRHAQRGPDIHWRRCCQMPAYSRFGWAEFKERLGLTFGEGSA